MLEEFARRYRQICAVPRRATPSQLWELALLVATPFHLVTCHKVMASVRKLDRNRFGQIEFTNMSRTENAGNGSAARRRADAARRGYVPPSQARSRNMAAVKRSDTRPELDLRRALHAEGYRFRKDHAIRIDGRLIRPDIVFTRKRIAIFVDGCFWHGCPLHGETPASNINFWKQKLTANVARDRAQDSLLGTADWTVLRIWEHVPTSDALAEVVSLIERSAM